MTSSNFRRTTSDIFLVGDNPLEQVGIGQPNIGILASVDDNGDLAHFRTKLLRIIDDQSTQQTSEFLLRTENLFPGFELVIDQAPANTSLMHLAIENSRLRFVPPPTQGGAQIFHVNGTASNLNDTISIVNPTVTSVIDWVYVLAGTLGASSTIELTALGTPQPLVTNADFFGTAGGQAYFYPNRPILNAGQELRLELDLVENTSLGIIVSVSPIDTEIQFP